MYEIWNLPDTTFPKSFLWGSATAGHQIEGDNVNSHYWKWEKEGKFGTPSGKACDHWRLWRQDFDLMKRLGHRGYRFSVEWARIEPRRGEFDLKALEQYLAMLRRLKRLGIRAYVTLHHFTHPQWFEDLGGFAKRDNIGHFLRYLEFVVPRLSPWVDAWNVFNEFNLGLADRFDYKFNQVRAHALGYHLIKAHSRAPVSTAHAFVHWFARRADDHFDQIARDYMDWATHEFFFHAIRTGEVVLPGRDAEYVPEAKGAIDFWAVNYYTRHMIDARKRGLEGQRFAHQRTRMIPMDFFLEEAFPEGLIANLERLKDKPVIITENGCCCDDDRWRVLALATHLCALREAIDRGVDVRGYFHWSFMDNFEWGSFVPRFGLVSVDFKTFKRTPKPSAWFFKEVIERNGFDRKLLAKYLKGFPKLKQY